MSRKLPLVAITLLLAFSALAKDRSVSSTRPPGDLRLGSGASVTGEVTAVAGNLITLAGGLVTIDAGNARILVGDGPATIAAVRPGALIAATLQEPGTVSNGPLVATHVAILRNADVTLTGTAQSVDVAGGRFVLLNRTIKVGENTTFVNFDRASLSSVQANSLVIVEANASGEALLASRITHVAPIPPRPQIASGVVKSIGTDAWVITLRDTDTTFAINASTKILGSPKAGDKVEVLYTVDSAHANVALTIIKSIELPKIVTFNGVVKSIEGSRCVVTRDEDQKDIALATLGGVRLPSSIDAGDHVVVVASQNTDGTYTLLTIMPRR